WAVLACALIAIIPYSGAANPLYQFCLALPDTKPVPALTEMPLTLVARIQPSFHEYRVSRHGETKYPENEACENETGCGRLRRSPLGIGEVLPDDDEQNEDADDVDEAGILEDTYEGIDDPRNDQFQRLRQDEHSGFLPVTQAQRIRAFILP